MKKTVMRLFLAALLTVMLLTGLMVSAQGAGGESSGANEDLVTFILDDFEKASAWIPEMPRDQGVIFSMAREGQPPLLKRMDEFTRKIQTNNARYLEEQDKRRKDMTMTNVENPLAGFPYRASKYVLGVRVEFIKRGYNWFTVKPPMPIKVPGIAKSVKVWVAGRGYQHWLWLMIRDYYGSKRYLAAMRPLTHKGWRQVIFPIRQNIRQEDYKTTDPKKVGITFDGFLVNCDPLESQGTYYIYFDMLTADVDLYFEFHQDEDDMKDYW